MNQSKSGIVNVAVAGAICLPLVGAVVLPILLFAWLLGVMELPAGTRNAESVVPRSNGFFRVLRGQVYGDTREVMTAGLIALGIVALIVGAGILVGMMLGGLCG